MSVFIYIIKFQEKVGYEQDGRFRAVLSDYGSVDGEPDNRRVALHPYNHTTLSFKLSIHRCRKYVYSGKTKNNNNKEMT